MTTPSVPAAATSTAPDRRVPVTSRYGGRGQVVLIDPWAENPLLEELAQGNPSLFKVASASATPPTLFESGNLPPFLASGVDPQHLMLLPYTARHAAAAEPDPGTVLRMIEESADNPDAYLLHRGLDEYQTRVSRWASGASDPKPVVDPAEDEALYERMFGVGTSTGDQAAIPPGPRPTKPLRA